MNRTATTDYVPALGFHWLTPFYDAAVRIGTRERAFKLALIEQAGLACGQRVLDLACGTGTLAIWMSQIQCGLEVTGIDADPRMLGVAARKAHRAEVKVRFDNGLSTELPYADGSFDRVLSSLFFHHLSWADKQRSAQELLRVLKPGGELHVADWGRASGALMRTLYLQIQLLDGFPNTQDNVAGRLPAVFRDAGFERVSEQTRFATGFGTMALYRACKPA